jgi:pterin-4a-carbinolamine dehydratase
VKSIVRLHEDFINLARRPMSFDKLPVAPVVADLPVIPTNKWKKTESSIEKKFLFPDKIQRNKYIRKLFEYEEDVGHHAEIFIVDNEVMLSLSTHDVNKVTELDKEYARYADELYKESLYSFDSG